MGAAGANRVSTNILILNVKIQCVLCYQYASKHVSFRFLEYIETGLGTWTTLGADESTCDTDVEVGQYHCIDWFIERQPLKFGAPVRLTLRNSRSFHHAI